MGPVEEARLLWRSCLAPSPLLHSRVLVAGGRILVEEAAEDTGDNNATHGGVPMLVEAADEEVPSGLHYWYLRYWKPC
jgi:hypothetical protein